MTKCTKSVARCGVAGQAAKLGLVDGCGTLQTTMRERFGDKVRGLAWLRRTPALTSAWHSSRVG